MKVALLWLAFITGSYGHGYISMPTAVYYDNALKTTYNTITDEHVDSAFSGLKWDSDPDDNLKTFTLAFNKTKFTSLKNMFDVVKVDCGNSRIDISSIDVSNMNTMNWQNDEYKEGFINSHSGPCEAWIDNKMVAQSNDCRTTYHTYPAIIPIDYTSCDGNCLLEFYWAALHMPQWQLYKQCVPIVNTNTKITNNETTTIIKCVSGNATCGCVTNK